MTETRIDLARLLAGGGHSHVAVERWGFLRFEQPSRGINLTGSEDGYPRLSSRVVAVDIEAMTATTASGRVYILVGDPDPEYAVTVPKTFDRLRGSAYSYVDLSDVAETIEQAALSPKAC